MRFTIRIVRQVRGVTILDALIGSVSDRIIYLNCIDKPAARDVV